MFATIGLNELHFVRPQYSNRHEIANVKIPLKPIRNEVVAPNESYCASSVRPPVYTRRYGWIAVIETNHQSFVVFSKQAAGGFSGIDDALIVIGDVSTPEQIKARRRSKTRPLSAHA
ncbi:hypothetical protein GAO09_04090 [Rhizobiales bacterium RZME27]|uniref:Uncharacterized protein n=1 Tax=Endobacterium cereale TaxID=2663029 RepID=A0A6A8A5X0_9HYPH|nr:hypothetical protein [Endobacterium cereale]MQY45247.1 hypothetical protein [Endobacterium cereale]